MFREDALSKSKDMALRVFLVVDAVLVTLSYLYCKDPLFHQGAFGLHCVAMAYRGSRHYRKLQKSPEKRQLLALLTAGWGTQLLGFACWNVDNLFCPQLRMARAWLGPWLSWLLQLHGWWHVLTGIGAYTYIVANQWMNLLRNDRHKQWRVRWRCGFLAVVEPLDEATAVLRKRK